MSDTNYSIGTFAELSGIPVRTLHYYEEVGLLCPHRQANGHRIYGTTDLITLQKIIGLKSIGFSLERIRKFLHHQESEMSLAETLNIQQQALQAAALNWTSRWRSLAGSKPSCSTKGNWSMT